MDSVQLANAAAGLDVLLWSFAAACGLVVIVGFAAHRANMKSQEALASMRRSLDRLREAIDCAKGMEACADAFERFHLLTGVEMSSEDRDLLVRLRTEVAQYMGRRPDEADPAPTPSMEEARRIYLGRLRTDAAVLLQRSQELKTTIESELAQAPSATAS